MSTHEIICAIYTYLVDNGHSKSAHKLLKESKLDDKTIKKTKFINLNEIMTRSHMTKISNTQSLSETKSNKKQKISHLPHLKFNFQYILAPMVGASELPFRLLCRKYGAQLAYTPMMSSEKFAVDEDYRKTEFQTNPEDRPLVAHFSGNNADTMLKAAKYVESHCDAIGE